MKNRDNEMEQTIKFIDDREEREPVFESDGEANISDPIFIKVIGYMGEWLATSILKKGYFGWSLKRLPTSSLFSQRFVTRDFKPGIQTSVPHNVDFTFIEKNKLEWEYFVPDDAAKELIVNAQTWDFLLIDRGTFLKHKETFLKAAKEYEYAEYYTNILEKFINEKLTILDYLRLSIPDTKSGVNSILSDLVATDEKWEECYTWLKFFKHSQKKRGRTDDGRRLLNLSFDLKTKKDIIQKAKEIDKNKLLLAQLKKTASKEHKKQLVELKNKRKKFQEELRKIQPILLDVKTRLSNTDIRIYGETRKENIPKAIRFGFKLSILKINIRGDKVYWNFDDEENIIS
jgi:hypothetical protein